MSSPSSAAGEATTGLAIAIDSTPAYDMPNHDGSDSSFYNSKLGQGPANYIYNSSTIDDPRLVRFLKEFYLCPGGNPTRGILRALFGEVPEDLSTAPRETTLQRAILDHVSGGHRMVTCAGRGTLFPEDFEWGKQVYRKDRFPWHLVE